MMLKLSLILVAVVLVRTAHSVQVERLCDKETGTSVDPKCTNGKITVSYANYGRATGDETTCTSSAATSCNKDAAKYLESAKKLCDGKQSCTVEKLKLADPCPGISKYLEVKYECSDMVERKCEGAGNSVSLLCPNTGLIKVEFANFGRTESSATVCPYHAFHYNDINCKRDLAQYTSHAKGLCDGKKFCTVPMLNMGDPCYMTYKYLEVKYSCTGMVQQKCESDGTSVNLQCPNGGKMKVESANFGRTTADPKDCPLLCNKDTAKYTESAKKLCDGKNSCTVEKLKLDDPCPGTSKYLEVAHDCTGLVKTQCEADGSSLTILCPSSGLIKVESANFGRTESSAWVCPYHTNNNDINCNRDQTQYTSHAKGLCDGKNYCTVTRLNLGDACPGTYKYLEVKYSCTKMVRTTCESEGTSVKPQCPCDGLIKIDTANYGRTTSDPNVCPLICDKHAAEYTETAKSLCDGKDSCKVEKLPLDDPCPEAKDKYLEVRYNCTETGLVQRRCEGTGSSVTIQCSENRLIAVESANFGRTESSATVCPYNGFHYNDINCRRDQARYTSHAKGLCDGKNSCTVPLLNLGDPCYMTYKYLEVKYSCIS